MVIKICGNCKKRTGTRCKYNKNISDLNNWCAAWKGQKTTVGDRVEPVVSCGEMIRIYLEQNGYDGLVERDSECGCELDNLMPCESDDVLSCQAGHKIMECTCGEGCPFHIVAGKRNR